MGGEQIMGGQIGRPWDAIIAILSLPFIWIIWVVLCSIIFAANLFYKFRPQPKFPKPSGQCPHGFVGKIFCAECDKDN